jgi:hypothetical protein
MTDLHLFTTMSVGFFLGARHALEADHVAAVSTLVAGRRGAAASGLAGACWGVGHTATLLLVGLIVMALGLKLPPAFAAICETLVGVMLIVLGGSLAWTLWRDRWHIHAHTHGGQAHLHLHTHRHDEGHGHDHDRRALVKPMVVGMVHGLAGSAALMLLVLATVRTAGEGLAYIAVFGAGSILAMAAIGAVMSWPIVRSLGRGQGAVTLFQAAASLGSIVLGVMTLAGQLPILTAP